MSFPNVYFGVVNSHDLDWRANLSYDPDDDADTPAPEDVVNLLGFDPDEVLSEEEE